MYPHTYTQPLVRRAPNRPGSEIGVGEVGWVGVAPPLLASHLPPICARAQEHAGRIQPGLWLSGEHSLSPCLSCGEIWNYKPHFPAANLSARWERSLPVQIKMRLNYKTTKKTKNLVMTYVPNYGNKGRVIIINAVLIAKILLRNYGWQL